jgi:hypothetical protein
MRHTELPKTKGEWYQLGFDEQEWGYPLLDHVWKKRTIFNWYPKYPQKFQQSYRDGQVDSWINGRAKDKPWFYEEK